MYKLALLFAIVATARAQFVTDGACDFPVTIPPANLFKQTRAITVTVNMVEIKRISNPLNTGQCMSGSLVINGKNGDSISVHLREVVDEKLIEHNGTISLSSQNFYTVVFPNFTSNFTILKPEDDFDVAVLYACSNVGQQKHEYAWVVATNTTLTEEQRIVTQTAIELLKLNNATWVDSSHTAESCKSGATINFKLSPIIVLIVGFVVSKGL